MWAASFPRPGAVRLAFLGGDALDTANAQEAKAAALAAIGDATDVFVDLGEIEFIDSSGLSVLVALFKAMRSRGGRVRFHGPRPAVRSILAIIRLDLIFEITDEAVEV